MSFFTSEWLFPQKEHIVRLEARAMGWVGWEKGRLSGGQSLAYDAPDEMRKSREAKMITFAAQ
jgi:hypothetical protein